MTTTPLSPAELREMLEKATALPWEYRPWKHDDWGTIRGPRLPDDEPDYPGPHVAMARAGYYPNDAEMDQHRQAGTDPYGPNATLIVSAVNSLPALLDELDRVRKERDEFRKNWKHDAEEALSLTAVLHDILQDPYPLSGKDLLTYRERIDRAAALVPPVQPNPSDEHDL